MKRLGYQMMASYATETTVMVYYYTIFITDFYYVMAIRILYFDTVIDVVELPESRNPPKWYVWVGYGRTSLYLYNVQ